MGHRRRITSPATSTPSRLPDAEPVRQRTSLIGGLVVMGVGALLFAAPSLGDLVPAPTKPCVPHEEPVTATQPERARELADRISESPERADCVLAEYNMTRGDFVMLSGKMEDGYAGAALTSAMGIVR